MVYFFLVVIVALLGAHLAVYKTFLSVFPDFSFTYLFVIRAAFVILFLSFPIAAAVSSKYDSVFSSILYTISSAWLGVLFYLFLASALYWIIFLLADAVSLGSGLVWSGRILLALAVIVSAYGFYHAENIQVSRVNVSLPGLPDSWKGRTVVFISDMHLGQVHGEAYAKRIAGMVRELNPDMIFDGGDLYDGVATADPDRMIAPLAELKPPLGYYLVTGNHEYFGDTAAFKNAIKEAGIKELDNKAVEINGVRLIGADYRSSEKVDGFSSVLESIPKSSQPTILLKHVPLNLDVAEKYGVSLQLSGHTHRAQIFPLNFITDMVYKGYDHGLKDYGSMKVLVSDGVGTWGPPMRVGTNPEIVLITFSK